MRVVLSIFTEATRAFARGERNSVIIPSQEGWKQLAHSCEVRVVQEPFLLDDELREKVERWVEWANKADPSEYDPFAKGENNE